VRPEASVAEDENGDFVRAKQRIGQVLRDKYRIDRVIGVGGMAAVYAATHRNQKQFAVKVLHTELSYRDDIRTRFLREGYAANSVKHSGAVAVLDDDVAEDGAAFLVMELLEGASVEALAEQAGGRLGEGYAIGIAYQLLDTLASAHAQGIVHRDIKPANLFVTREGQLKVLDFGIARVRDVASGGANVTGTGMLLGTPAYMAPEQALGKSSEIDAQTDLWAVGATLFTLLSGRLVHDGETPSHLMILAATTPARSLAVVAPHVSPAVVGLVDGALAFAKASRWPSAAAMRDAARDACIGAFGRMPSRESLMPLVGGDPGAQGQGGQPPMISSYVSTPIPGAYPAPAITRSGTGPGTGARPFMPIAGGTTAQPVASDEPVPSRPAGVPRARPGVLIAVAVAGLLVCAGGGVALVRSLAGPASSTSESPATTAPPTPTTLPGAASPSAQPSSQTAASTSAPQAAASAPTAAIATLTPLAPLAAHPTPPTVNLPAWTPAAANAPGATSPATAAAKAHPSAPPFTTAAPQAPAGATPTCHVVSFFDSDGNKHFRQECH
jgi:serine/threonine-protein kinase